MSGTKDLAYYNANPEDLADMSPEQLEALASGESISDSTEESRDDKQEGGATSGAATAEGNTATDDESAAAAEGATETEGDDAEGVLAKDGKNVLPFSVLQGTREEKARLERLVHEQTAEIERLRAGGVAGDEGKAATTEPDAPLRLTEEDLAALEEESPSLAKILRAQQATIDRLAGEAAARTEERGREVADEVQSIIDGKPKLAHLQATNPEAWAEVIATDNRLASSGKWKGKPMAERFDAVVRLYEAENGAIQVPGGTATAQQTETKPAAASRRGPTTLSDLPGGAAVPVDEQASIEQASSIELTRRFEDMTPEQIDAFIASSGG
jgi:hypothetical protein